MKAPDFCTKAAKLMDERGKDRDKPSGERSMSRCVETFNAMTGHNLTEEDGWLFMVYLKHSRMRAGKFRQDDYEDAVAYEALMAEAAQPEPTLLTTVCTMPHYFDMSKVVKSMYPEDDPE